MGSYCSIQFDDLEVLSAKSVVPDSFCALFQESDRVLRHSHDLDGEDAKPDVLYEVPRTLMLDRLSLLGCTAAVIRYAYEEWRQREIVDRREGDLDEHGKAEIAALSALTFDEWQRRVPQILRTRYSDTEPVDIVDRNMREQDSSFSWLWFDGYGTHLNIRALLDACSDVDKVSLDVSDLIGSGYLEEDVAVCAARRDGARFTLRPLAPTVILAEGSSDIRILQRSLMVLFPDKRDYFSFFNHAELNVDGGAPYLVKFLKAFAAARAPLQIVAIFDNDATGLQMYRQAARLYLPRNMMVLCLPDIELAREYPTVGPQGAHTVNVNGLAGSIELYLGRRALTKDGALRRVRWGGYIVSEGIYQGEVEGKGEVEAAFLAEIESYPTADAARAAYPELVAVWQAVFAAVEATAEMAQRENLLIRDDNIW